MIRAFEGTSDHWDLDTGSKCSTLPSANWELTASGSFFVVCFLTFSIPWGDMVTISGILIPASRVVTFVALAAWLLGEYTGSRHRQAPALFGLMVLFVLWAAITSLWTVNPDRTMRRLLSYIQLFFDAWLVFAVATNSERYAKLLQAYVFGCYLLCAGVLASFLSDLASLDLRYSAVGFDPNEAACTLGLAIPVSTYLANVGGRWKTSNLLYPLAAVVAIVLTGSRTGLLVLIPALLYPLWTVRHVRRRLTVLLLILTIAGGAEFLRRQGHERTLSRASLTDPDMNGRLPVWRTGYGIFSQNVFLGVGAGGFSQSVVSDLGYESVAHNTFLEVLVEHGLPGFACFTMLICWLVFTASRFPALERKLWLTLLAIWFISATALSWENREVTWLLFGLCAAQSGNVIAHEPALISPAAPENSVPRVAPSQRGF